MKMAFSQRYSQFVVNHPWTLLLLTLLLVLAASSGGRFIEFTNDYRVFFQ
jgi:hypothetical protein